MEFDLGPNEVALPIMLLVKPGMMVHHLGYIVDIGFVNDRTVYSPVTLKARMSSASIDFVSAARNFAEGRSSDQKATP